MFVRRHFYDLTTGQTLYSYMMQGDIIIQPIEEVRMAYNISDNSDYFEWFEPDSDIEQAFETCALVTVDVGAEPHRLVFDYTPIEAPDAPTYSELSDYYNPMTEAIEGATNENGGDEE